MAHISGENISTGMPVIVICAKDVNQLFVWPTYFVKLGPIFDSFMLNFGMIYEDDYL